MAENFQKPLERRRVMPTGAGMLDEFLKLRDALLDLLEAPRSFPQWTLGPISLHSRNSQQTSLLRWRLKVEIA